MRKFIISILLFSAFGVLGVLLVRQAKPLKPIHPSAGSRDPAAIRPNFDFSAMEGPRLLEATKERLIAGARVLRRQGHLGVEFGHFVIRGKSGQKIFGCEQYSGLEMIFDGDGTIIDGKKPSLVVSSPCRISSSDVNRIEPVWIPASEILSAGIETLEFQDPVRATTVRFSEIYDQWPTLWALKEVRLLREGEHPLVLGEEEIHKFSREANLLDFNLVK